MVMVDAAYVPSAMVTHTQSFIRAENNHTYVYSEGPPANWYEKEFLVHEEDVDIDSYYYEAGDWEVDSSSYMGLAEREFYLGPGYTGTWGWLDEPQWIPTFRDFETEDPESEIGAKSIHNTFPLAVNAEQTVFLDPGYIYFGTFNVTDEEFFHLTVETHQDDTSLRWGILDFDWRWLDQGFIYDTDIDVIPFMSTGTGTYFLIVELTSDDPAPVPIDFLFEPVVPEVIAFGDIVEGELPGGELIVDDETGGSFVVVQKRPNVFTYKFSTNSTQFGRLSVLFENTASGVGPSSYPEQAILTCGIFEGHMAEEWLWSDSMNTPSSVFYYGNFVNETYYLTILGMENSKFTILNQMVDIPVLPLNEEFFVQNWQSYYMEYPYRLSLGQDSVVRLNRTEWNSGFYWQFWTVTEDGYSETFPIVESATFEGASTHYLPAGDYLIRARSESQSAAGLYEFNLGPILEGAGNVEVEVDRLLGVRVPVENLMFYRTNITLLTHDNVTVYTDIDFINYYGNTEVAFVTTLGNRQFGVSWQAFGANTTSFELGLDTTSYSMFCDGYAIIAIAPYDIVNNTAGLDNDLYGRKVDFEITFYEDEETILTDVDSVSLGNDLVWSNFTLLDTGDVNEHYAVRISGAEGTWMNLSIIVDDVADWEAFVYQDMSGCPQYLPWSGELGYTFVGDFTGESSFQFGGISNDIVLVFHVIRSLSANGSLNIGIMPYMANSYEYLPLPTYYFYGFTPGPAASLVIDPLLAVGGLAVIAVVVVVVVFARKTGRI